MSLMYYSSMPAFEHYFQPVEVDEVVSLLVKYGREAKVMAGGTDLLVLMRHRTVVPKCIIGISRISGLGYIEYDNTSGLKIGALTQIRALELEQVVRGKYPLLYEAAHQMGTIEIRNMGTVVGNVCRASPSADMVPPLLALDAKLKIVGPDNIRLVPLDEFFTGPGETVLKHCEIVTEIQIPRLEAGTGTAFFKITRVTVDLAKVNVATVIKIKDGFCQLARVALGGVAPIPIRVKKAEEFLKNKKLEDSVIEEAAKIAADETKPISDVRSTGEYRKEVSKVITARGMKISWERAKQSCEE